MSLEGSGGGNVIDERVVRLGLDTEGLNNGTESAKKALDLMDKSINDSETKYEKYGEKIGKVTDTFKDKISGAFGKSQTDIEDFAGTTQESSDKVVESLDQMSEAGAKVKQSVSIWTVAAGNMIANFATNAINKITSVVKSLTIDQVVAGYSKYEQYVTNAQSLKSTTRDSWKQELKAIKELDTAYAGITTQMGYVEKALSKINWFSDETSVPVESLTNNLSSLTAAGKSVTDSINDLIGATTYFGDMGASISSTTALLEQFTQAMSKGKFTLQDWQSLETRGVVSNAMVESLIDIAGRQSTSGKKSKDGDPFKNAGMLTKKADGYYIQKSKDEEVKLTAKTYKDVLSKGWLTDEVMSEFVKSYSNSVDKIQKVYDLAGRVAGDDNEYLSTSRIIELAQDYRAAGDNAEKLKEQQEKLKEAAEEYGISASVLTEEIKELAKAENKAGVDGFKQIQSAKSMADVLGTVSTAVSGRFKQIFQDIIGDSNNAVSAFTLMANSAYDILVEPFDNIQSATSSFFNKLLNENGDVVESLKYSSEEMKKMVSTEKGLTKIGNSLGISAKAVKEIASQKNGIQDLINMVEKPAKVKNGYTMRDRIFGQFDEESGSLIKEGVLSKYLDTAYEISSTLSESFVQLMGFEGYDDAVETTMTRMINGLEFFAEKFGSVSSVLLEVVSNISQIISPFTNAIKSLIGIVVNKNTIGVITDAIESIGGILSSLLSLDEYSGNKLVKIGSFGQVIKNIADVISGFAGAISRSGIVGSSIKMVSSTIKLVIDTIVNIINSVGQLLNSITGGKIDFKFKNVENVLTSIADVFDKVSEWINKLNETINGKGSLFDRIRDFGLNIKNNLGNLKIIQDASKVITKISESFVNFFNNIKEKFGNLTKKNGSGDFKIYAIEKIKDVLSKLGEKIKSIVTSIKEKVLGVLDKLGLTEIINEFKSKNYSAAFSKLFDYIKDNYKEIIKVISIGSSAVAGVVKIAQNIYNGVYDEHYFLNFGTKIKDFVKNLTGIFGEITDAIGDAWDGVFRFTTSGIQGLIKGKMKYLSECLKNIGIFIVTVGAGFMFISKAMLNFDQVKDMKKTLVMGLAMLTALMALTIPLVIVMQGAFKNKIFKNGSKQKIVAGNFSYVRSLKALGVLIIEIALAFSVIADAMLVLNDVDMSTLAKGEIILGTLILTAFGLVLTLSILSSKSRKSGADGLFAKKEGYAIAKMLKTAGIMIIELAIATKILAGAFSMFDGVSWSAFAKGQIILLELVAVAAGIVAFITIASKAEDKISLGSGIGKLFELAWMTEFVLAIGGFLAELAAATAIMAIACHMFEGVSWSAFAKAAGILVLLTASTVLIVTALKGIYDGILGTSGISQMIGRSLALGSSIGALAVFIASMGFAMIELSAACLILNKVDTNSILKAGLLMGGLVLALYAIITMVEQLIAISRIGKASGKISLKTIAVFKSLLMSIEALIFILTTSLVALSISCLLLDHVEWSSIGKAGAIMGGMLLSVIGLVSVVASISKIFTTGKLKALAGSYIFAEIMSSIIALMYTISIIVAALGLALREFNAIEWSSIGKAATVLGGMIAAITMLLALSVSITEIFTHQEVGKIAAPFEFGEILGSIIALLYTITINMAALGLTIREFNKVEWSSIGKAATVLGSMIAAITMLLALSVSITEIFTHQEVGKIAAPFEFGEILGSIIALLYTISINMAALGGAIAIFNKVEWSSIGKAGVVLGGMIAAITMLLTVSTSITEIFTHQKAGRIAAPFEFGEIIGSIIALLYTVANSMIIISSSAAIFNSVDTKSIIEMLGVLAGLEIAIVTLVSVAFGISEAISNLPRSKVSSLVFAEIIGSVIALLYTISINMAIISATLKTLNDAKASSIGKMALILGSLVGAISILLAVSLGIAKSFSTVDGGTISQVLTSLKFISVIKSVIKLISAITAAVGVLSKAAVSLESVDQSSINNILLMVGVLTLATSAIMLVLGVTEKISNGGLFKKRALSFAGKASSGFSVTQAIGISSMILSLALATKIIAGACSEIMSTMSSVKDAETINKAVSFIYTIIGILASFAGIVALISSFMTEHHEYSKMSQTVKTFGKKSTTGTDSGEYTKNSSLITTAISISGIILSMALAVKMISETFGDLANTINNTKASKIKEAEKIIAVIIAALSSFSIIVLLLSRFLSKGLKNIKEINPIKTGVSNVLSFAGVCLTILSMAAAIMIIVDSLSKLAKTLKNIDKTKIDSINELVSKVVLIMGIVSVLSVVLTVLSNISSNKALEKGGNPIKTGVSNVISLAGLAIVLISVGVAVMLIFSSLSEFAETVKDLDSTKIDSIKGIVSNVLKMISIMTVAVGLVLMISSIVSSLASGANIGKSTITTLTMAASIAGVMLAFAYTTKIILDSVAELSRSISGASETDITNTMDIVEDVFLQITIFMVAMAAILGISGAVGGAVGSATGGLYTICSNVSKAVTGGLIIGALLAIGKSVGEIFEGISSLMSSIKGASPDEIQACKDIIEDVIDALSDFLIAYSLNLGITGAIGGAAGTGTAGIYTICSSISKGVTGGLIIAAINSVGESAAGIFESISSVMSKIKGDDSNVIKEKTALIKVMFSNIRTLLESFVTLVDDNGTGMWKALTNDVTANSISTILGGLSTFLKSFKDLKVDKNTMDSLSNIKSFVDDTLGPLVTTIQDKLSKFTNNVVPTNDTDGKQLLQSFSLMTSLFDVIKNYGAIGQIKTKLEDINKTAEDIGSSLAKGGALYNLAASLQSFAEVDETNIDDKATAAFNNLSNSMTSIFEVMDGMKEYKGKHDVSPFIESLNQINDTFTSLSEKSKSWDIDSIKDKFDQLKTALNDVAQAADGGETGIGGLLSSLGVNLDSKDLIKAATDATGNINTEKLKQLTDDKVKEVVSSLNLSESNKQLATELGQQWVTDLISNIQSGIASGPDPGEEVAYSATSIQGAIQNSASEGAGLTEFGIALSQWFKSKFNQVMEDNTLDTETSTNIESWANAMMGHVSSTLKSTFQEQLPDILSDAITLGVNEMNANTDSGVKLATTLVETISQSLGSEAGISLKTSLTDYLKQSLALDDAASFGTFTTDTAQTVVSKLTAALKTSISSEAQANSTKSLGVTLAKGIFDGFKEQMSSDTLDSVVSGIVKVLIDNAATWKAAGAVAGTLMQQGVSEGFSTPIQIEGSEKSGAVASMKTLGENISAAIAKSFESIDFSACATALKTQLINELSGITFSEDDVSTLSSNTWLATIVGGAIKSMGEDQTTDLSGSISKVKSEIASKISDAISDITFDDLDTSTLTSNLETKLKTLDDDITLEASDFSSIATALSTAVSDALSKTSFSKLDLTKLCDKIKSKVEKSIGKIEFNADKLKQNLNSSVQGAVDGSTGNLTASFTVGDIDTNQGVESVKTLAHNLSNAFSTTISSGKDNAKKAGETLANAAKAGLSVYNASQARAAGESIGSGFASGILSKSGSASLAAKSIGNIAINALRSSLGIHSPSREAYSAGEYFVQGFVNGLKAIQGPLVNAATAIGGKALSSLQSEANAKAAEEAAKSNGENVVAGMQAGIEDSARQKALAQSAQKLAGLVPGIVKSNLKIHSPSRVMAELGKYIVDGYSIGLRDFPSIYKYIKQSTKITSQDKKDLTSALSGVTKNGMAEIINQLETAGKTAGARFGTAFVESVRTNFKENGNPLDINWSSNGMNALRSNIQEIMGKNYNESFFRYLMESSGMATAFTEQWNNILTDLYNANNQFEQTKGRYTGDSGLLTGDQKSGITILGGIAESTLSKMGKQYDKFLTGTAEERKEVYAWFKKNGGSYLKKLAKSSDGKAMFKAYVKNYRDPLYSNYGYTKESFETKYSLKKFAYAEEAFNKATKVLNSIDYGEFMNAARSGDETTVNKFLKRLFPNGQSIKNFREGIAYAAKNKTAYSIYSTQSSGSNSSIGYSAATRKNYESQLRFLAKLETQDLNTTETYAKGTKVGGVDIGGLTKLQAYNKLSQNPDLSNYISAKEEGTINYGTDIFGSKFVNTSAQYWASQEGRNKINSQRNKIEAKLAAAQNEVAKLPSQEDFTKQVAALNTDRTTAKTALAAYQVYTGIDDALKTGNTAKLVENAKSLNVKEKYLSSKYFQNTKKTKTTTYTAKNDIKNLHASVTKTYKANQKLTKAEYDSLTAAQKKNVTKSTSAKTYKLGKTVKGGKGPGGVFQKYITVGGNKKLIKFEKGTELTEAEYKALYNSGSSVRDKLKEAGVSSSGGTTTYTVNKGFTATTKPSGKTYTSGQTLTQAEYNSLTSEQKKKVKVSKSSTKYKINRSVFGGKNAGKIWGKEITVNGKKKLIKFTRGTELTEAEYNALMKYSDASSRLKGNVTKESGTTTYTIKTGFSTTPSNLIKAGQTLSTADIKQLQSKYGSNWTKYVNSSTKMTYGTSGKTLSGNTIKATDNLKKRYEVAQADLNAAESIINEYNDAVAEKKLTDKYISDHKNDTVKLTVGKIGSTKKTGAITVDKVYKALYKSNGEAKEITEKNYKDIAKLLGINASSLIRSSKTETTGSGRNKKTKTTNTFYTIDELLGGNQTTSNYKKFMDYADNKLANKNAIGDIQKIKDSYLDRAKSVKKEASAYIQWYDTYTSEKETAKDNYYKSLETAVKDANVVLNDKFYTLEEIQASGAASSEDAAKTIAKALKKNGVYKNDKATVNVGFTYGGKTYKKGQELSIAAYQKLMTDSGFKTASSGKITSPYFTTKDIQAIAQGTQKGNTLWENLVKKQYKTIDYKALSKAANEFVTTNSEIQKLTDQLSWLNNFEESISSYSDIYKSIDELAQDTTSELGQTAADFLENIKGITQSVISNLGKSAVTISDLFTRVDKTPSTTLSEMTSNLKSQNYANETFRAQYNYISKYMSDNKMTGANKDMLDYFYNSGDYTSMEMLYKAVKKGDSTTLKKLSEQYSDMLGNNIKAYADSLRKTTESEYEMMQLQERAMKELYTIDKKGNRVDVLTSDLVNYLIDQGLWNVENLRWMLENKDDSIEWLTGMAADLHDQDIFMNGANSTVAKQDLKIRGHQYKKGDIIAQEDLDYLGNHKVKQGWYVAKDIKKDGKVVFKKGTYVNSDLLSQKGFTQKDIDAMIKSGQLKDYMVNKDIKIGDTTIKAGSFFNESELRAKGLSSSKIESNTISGKLSYGSGVVVSENGIDVLKKAGQYLTDTQYNSIDGLDDNSLTEKVAKSAYHLKEDYLEAAENIYYVEKNLKDSKGNVVLKKGSYVTKSDLSKAGFTDVDKLIKDKSISIAVAKGNVMSKSASSKYGKAKAFKAWRSKDAAVTIDALMSHNNGNASTYGSKYDHTKDTGLTAVRYDNESIQDLYLGDSLVGQSMVLGDDVAITSLSGQMASIMTKGTQTAAQLEAAVYHGDISIADIVSSLHDEVKTISNGVSGLKESQTHFFAGGTTVDALRDTFGTTAVPRSGASPSYNTTINNYYNSTSNSNVNTTNNMATPVSRAVMNRMSSLE